jgi:lysyl-tRNA synthetase class 2
MSRRIIERRREKVAALRARGIEPYPHGYGVTHRTDALRADFEDLAARESVVRVAGRLVAQRGHGKASFGHIEDGGGRIQVYCREDGLGADAYAFFLDLDLGDFVGLEGVPFVTRTGEMTVRASRIELLAKSVRPIPEKWHGLKDVETRYRQRYADLIANPEVRRVFVARARLVSSLRRFLDARGFIEVETPILQPIYGGAFARPFTTRHEALDTDLYLRISDELYLKRVIVGGFERVYEIGKDFRNEGMDRSHNPEFTQLELYQAYADYGDMMRLFEEMMAEAARELTGGLTVRYAEHELDFSPPWPRLSFTGEISRLAGEDVLDLDAEGCRRAAARLGVETTPGAGAGRILDEIFSEKIQPGLIRPTFVVDHPRELSPLAKVKRGDARLVERFEPVMAGLEVGNAFSEQNDPEEQARQFERQQELRRAGDLEAQVMDRDYIRALEYGMPPTGGLGVGIDRVTMILTDSRTIRDVILFPHLRPEEGLEDPDAEEDEEQSDDEGKGKG